MGLTWERFYGMLDLIPDFLGGFTGLSFQVYHISRKKANRHADVL
jgi:hypothetical protein